MQKRNLVVGIVIFAAFFVAAAVYYFYFYRPDWEVRRVARDGENVGQTVQTVAAARNYRDFEFSPTMNGLSSYLADLPASALMLSLSVRISELFVGENGATPGMQILIQNDDGTTCMFDVGNIEGEIQTLASGKICALGEKSVLMIRDASAMPKFSSGKIEVFAAYVALR